jgi:hypothetical protein
MYYALRMLRFCIMSYLFRVLQIEEDLTALQKKYTNLENEFDKVNEQYNEGVVKLEASEKRVTEVCSDFIKTLPNVVCKFEIILPADKAILLVMQFLLIFNRLSHGLVLNCI